MGKVAFGLATIAWDRLINKYASHTALFLLKLTTDLHNIKFESMEKNTDEWISNLEGLLIQINKFEKKEVLVTRIS